jgi:hypothetical protein
MLLRLTRLGRLSTPTCSCMRPLAPCLPQANRRAASSAPAAPDGGVLNADSGAFDAHRVSAPVQGEGDALKREPASISINAVVVSPEDVVFFDDVHENVAAALELGMRAYQVNGVDGVRERLVSEQLL